MKNLTLEQSLRIERLQQSTPAGRTFAPMRVSNPEQLLRAARFEFILDGGSANGRFMTAIRCLFHSIASTAYRTQFVWSTHNSREWVRFVCGELDQADCVFSADSTGELGTEGGGQKTFLLRKQPGATELRLMPGRGANRGAFHSAVALFPYDQS